MAESAEPLVNALNRPFWDAAARGLLVLPCCVDSRRPFWPPSPMSPFTGGPVEWRHAEPAGEVESLVTYRRPFQAAFADQVPYGIALVALAGGIRLHAHVEAPDASDAPRAGARVRLVFRPRQAGGTPLLIAITSLHPQP